MIGQHFNKYIYFTLLLLQQSNFCVGLVVGSFTSSSEDDLEEEQHRKDVVCSAAQPELDRNKLIENNEPEKAKLNKKYDIIYIANKNKFIIKEENLKKYNIVLSSDGEYK